MGSMSGSSNIGLELPKVGLSGLGLAGSGSEAWGIVQKEVAWAFANYGGFEAVFDDVEAELKDGLFGRAMPEVFKEEAKLSSAPPLSRSGAWFLQMPGIYKSLQLDSPEHLANVQDFAATIWPQGDDFFSNTVCNLAKYLQGLEQIVQKMILASVGLEDRYDSHIKSMAYSMRLAEYFENDEVSGTETHMPVHVDPNYISIIFPNNVEGLEVESPGHEWIHVTPLPNSFIVLLGEAFTVLTNGRFRAPKHRVKMVGSKKRYSAIFSSLPGSADDTINVLDKFVDGKHPLIYKPFKYYDYLDFRLSSEVKEDSLKLFCGLELEKIAA